MKTFLKKLIILCSTLIFSVSIFTSCKPADIAVESITLSSTEIEITEGTTQIVTYTLSPIEANSTITWQSSDNAVATVNELGLITAIAKGSCIITAIADGKVSSVIVTVKPKRPDFKALYDGLSNKYGWSLGADNSYLQADTNVFDLDNYSSTDTIYAIKDMNKKLGLPDSLFNDMCQTTWSMGKQVETYNSIGITVTWTYHPDKGMEVTYKLIAD